MDSDKGIQILFSWFGDKKFKIGDIGQERLLELLGPFGITFTTNIGTRSRLGQVITGLHHYRFTVSPNHDVRVIVVRKANDKIPGIYQMENVP